MLTKWNVPISMVITAGSALAQSSSTLPQTKSPPAITVRSTEITAALRGHESVAVADTALRVVSIESKYNVSVSVVRRSQVNGKTRADAVLHDAITEVYQIIEGNGVLVTGGTIDSASTLPADDPDVRYLIGPSSVGKHIRGGNRQEVAPGDVVIIPPHTPHGFSEIKTKRIVYTLIRVDPQRVLETKRQPR